MVTEAQKRATAKYHKANYKRLTVDLPIQVMDDFKAACERNQVSIASVIKEFMEQYVEDNSL